MNLSENSSMHLTRDQNRELLKRLHSSANQNLQHVLRARVLKLMVEVI